MARRAFARLRRLDLVTVIAMLVLAVGAVQLVDGALSAGVTIDEPIPVTVGETL